MAMTHAKIVLYEHLTASEKSLAYYKSTNCHGALRRIHLLLLQSNCIRIIDEVKNRNKAYRVL